MAPRTFIGFGLLLVAATALAAVTLVHWASEAAGFFFIVFLPFWLVGLAAYLLVGTVGTIRIMVSHRTERTPLNILLSGLAGVVATLLVAYVVFYLGGWHA